MFVFIPPFSLSIARLAVKFAVIVLLRRNILSGGSLIIEFDEVASVCFGKSFRPQVVSRLHKPMETIAIQCLHEP